jgi:3-deoxy-D-manno-octulosonic-acid transferase
MKALPGAGVTLTVGTWQGYRSACARAPHGVSVLPFPLDFRRVLKKAFAAIQPDLYVAFESEFWPNLAHFLREIQVPAVLINGRVTDRSFQRYSLLKPLFSPIFAQFEWLAMLSEEDRLNALKLGAPSDRTLVLGSSKVDGLGSRAKPENVAQWRRVLDLREEMPTVIGGSLRRSECAILLEVFCTLKEVEPRLVGLFAPRHLDRIADMVQWLEARRVPYQLLSRIESAREPRRESVVLVDRIGVLFDLYGLGDLIFCGGTLEPIGGHNILEPSAWGKPVFYGPNIQKVQHEHLTLSSFGGSFVVEDEPALLKAWMFWVRQRNMLKQSGLKAAEALESLGGVVRRQVELIGSVLRD